MMIRTGRGRLKTISKRIRIAGRLSADDRSLVTWAQQLNRPVPQDLKAADQDDSRWTP